MALCRAGLHLQRAAHDADGQLEANECEELEIKAQAIGDGGEVGG